MHRLIYLVFIIFVIQPGLCSDISPEDFIDQNDINLNTDDDFSLLITETTPSIEITTTITNDIVEEIVNEDVTDNVTVPIVTTPPTTTIIDEKETKSYLTEYLLNVNQSSSNITFNNYLKDSIILTINENEIYLINKQDGTIIKHFTYANIIPIKNSNDLVIFDDNKQELWIINSTYQQNSKISFKPKQLHLFSSLNNLLIAETSDELYVSEDTGLIWKNINDSSSSTILGWSNKANSLVILQHSNYLKLLDLTTYQFISISNDIITAKLFSRYLIAKKLNTDNSIAISHVNRLADNGFRPLPKRLQSEGNFYCAIEDSNTQDLLLLFITENKLGENNETIFSQCNLISYSKQNLFNLTNIDCRLINNNENSLNTLECSKEQLPFYQVQGLGKSVFLANVGSEPTTMISFDDGLNWNKTFYECDKSLKCPNNVSIIISSLNSASDAPGIVVGKAWDGVNEYTATSSDGGRTWKLNFKGNDYITAISNPNTLIVTLLKNNQQSSNHSFQYTTNYGYNWHEKTFLNDTSFEVLSLLADNENIFYILTLNNETLLNLIQLDFNLLITDQCARHQLKEWSLKNACINGSKFFYQRRIPNSYCLNNTTQIRNESCACLLSDFECLPGYKRSKDGVCLPRSHYTSTPDCTCNSNSTLLTKSRGYIKSTNSQCQNGIENYLSKAYVTRRDINQPNFFVYGIDSRTKRGTVKILTNDFDQNDDDEDEDEYPTQNTVWLIDTTYEITALAFNESGKQVYMAVEHDQLATIYRIGKNLRQQNRFTKELTFDSNNELYKSRDERIEYIAIDWLTQNLYVLIRNKNTGQQTVFILDVRTRKRRTIIKNQHIQPSILIIDPIKTELYWISHNSPSVFHIGNLQGKTKKQIQLSTTDSNVTYLAYDPIIHEIVYVINSNIYGLNTVDHHRLNPRVIYEHSSNIENPLFVSPVLYFTNENNQTDSPIISLNAIDILARSFAKNIAKFKDFNSLKLFIDMTPTMPTATTINRCKNNPCSDICIPLEHEGFRCICSEDARYQSCSCPTDERFITGSCQAKNGQCAPGRILCQNQINCAESARICELDHTQYTESFKTTARCTLDKPDDGFDCYYNNNNGNNNTCIPFEWLCDGERDCPLGNDEEHCEKLTTTKKPAPRIPSKCLTENKFTHAICHNKCMKIKDICQDISNALYCSEAFHLNCKQTHDKDQYVCKCLDKENRCITMVESCDDLETCEQVCKDSIHYANSKTYIWQKPESLPWLIIVAAVLGILIVAIVFIVVRYISRRKKPTTSSRTPDAAITSTANSPTVDTRERLLNNTSNNANETS